MAHPTLQAKLTGDSLTWIGGNMRANSRSSARTGLLGIVLLVLLLLLAVPADASALLSLQEPTSGSTTGVMPTFSGETDDAENPVKVLIYAGASVVGEPVLTLEATPPFAGSWSAQAFEASEALAGGLYTALAEQTEPLIEGEGLGQSSSAGPVSFEVDSELPTVSLAQPPPLSNDISPSFSGTASENTEVIVHVFQGSLQVAHATAIASGGAWSSSEVTPALAPGRHMFTAYAREKSGLGNKEGQSPTVSFEVNTEPPVVTLQSPPLVSHERTPAFSGTASEAGSVKVLLYKGAAAEGTPIKELTATVAENETWTSAHVNPALANGTYSAYAVESSRLGNDEGTSAAVSFEVSTEAPTVTLTAPAPRSNDTTPSFKGTVAQPDSEAEPVTVYIHEGSNAGGRIVSTVQATVLDGSWESANISPALAGANQAYTAVATTPSTIHNATGESAPATFIIDTQPPTVSLDQPSTPSNETKPAFSGISSEASAVTIFLYSGSDATGTPVAEVKGAEPAGMWTSAAVSSPLADGQYTAVASQDSAIGNQPGKSSPESFTIDTRSPVVTLKALPTPSPDRAPSFSGTAEADTPVTVDIHKGAKAEGAIVASSTAEGNGGEWVAGRLESPLPFGEYTAVATQPSPIGNPSGTSATITFTIEAIAPSAETEATTAVTRSSAALYASVNPNGGPVTSCDFEFGPTTAYGSQVECGFVSGLTAFPPAAAGAVPVFARVYGLHPSTTYHVRVVAVGEGGTGGGADVTFTTLDALVFPGVEVANTATLKTGASAVAGLFAAQLTPKGSAARIAALLRKGLFKQQFKAPEAGTATIKWLYQTPPVKGARKAARAPLLVASGKLKFPSAETAGVEIRLTKAGKLLLAKSRRIRLQATCSFRPVGGTSISASGTFLLVR